MKELFILSISFSFIILIIIGLVFLFFYSKKKIQESRIAALKNTIKFLRRNQFLQNRRIRRNKFNFRTDWELKGSGNPPNDKS